MKKQITKTLILLLVLGIFASFLVFFSNFYKLNYNREIYLIKELTTSTSLILDGKSKKERLEKLDQINQKSKTKYFLVDQGEDTINLTSNDFEYTIANFSKFLTEKKPISIVYNHKDYYLYAEKLGEGSVLIVLYQTNDIFSSFSETVPILVVLILVGTLMSMYISERTVNSFIRAIEEAARYVDSDKIILDPYYKEMYPLLRIIKDQASEINFKIEKLKEQSSAIDFIIYKMEEGMILLDKDMKILSINKSAIKLSNINPNINNLKGIFIFDLFRSFEFKNKIQKAVNNEEASVSFEIEIKSKIIKVIFSSVDQNNKDIGYVVLLVDNTKEKILELQRREFSANVSHELKTPLTSINGYAEMIMSGFVREEDTKKFAKVIYDEGNHLLRMIEDIIKIAHLDESEIELEEENIKLNDLIIDIVGILEKKATERNIKINFKSENDLFIKSNKRLLSELILNLIDNAIKYNKDNGQVNILIKDLLNNFIIEIEDTGIGIDEKEQDRIFERFYTVDKSHNKKDSSGLGLSIVKHIVKILNGEINLKSELGIGSKFTIKLPKNN